MKAIVITLWFIALIGLAVWAWVRSARRPFSEDELDNLEVWFIA